MEYEQLLESAYEKVEPCEECGRFEIMKVEGHFEGSKTVVTNFGQVATALRRGSDLVVKFLCKELASQCEVDGDRLVIVGKVNSKKINEKIEAYVKKFVLCKGCGKPDTEIVEEDGKMYLRCLACGAKNVLG